MGNGYASAARALIALLFVVSFAAPAAGQIIFLETTGRVLGGQSSSDSASTTLFAEGQLALDPPQSSATMRVGFNVNADAGPGLVAVEVGTVSFDLGFIVAHGGSFDILLDFLLRGQLLRLPDQECFGAVTLADITIASLVRVEDGMEFPLDVTLSGASIDFDAGTATFNFAQPASRVVQIRGDTAPTTAYRMSVIASVTALSQSCEVSARFGADNGSTTGCDACIYPGFGDRSRDEDGLFVTATIDSSLCGNIRNDPGEECDAGPLNGEPESCCDSFCRIVRRTDQVCRPAGSDCQQDAFCTGDQAGCGENPPKPAGSACSADQSPCTDDVCDSGGACTHPLRAGTVCDQGVCICDTDGAFCTGPVSCPEAGSLCIQLPPPCGEDDTCDEERDLCLNPFGTPIATATPTPTATPATPLPTATKTQVPCAGDCDGSRTVPLAEILFGVDLALGLQPVSECPAFDLDGDDKVTVDELVSGVLNQLTPCPS